MSDQTLPNEEQSRNQRLDNAEYNIKEAELPTPKGEKTGGGPKKPWRLGKKPGDFVKTSRDLALLYCRVKNRYLPYVVNM